MGAAICKEEFLRRAIEIHGDKYDYSYVNFIKNTIKVCICCPIHGNFHQTPVSHTQGHGCHVCGYKKGGMSVNDRNKESFLSRAMAVHGDVYDYSMTDYRDSRIRVKIICRIHGVFEQMPLIHLAGHGCKKCATHTLITETFISKSRKIHGDKYDYSMVEFSENNKPVSVICPKHGVFNIKPYRHCRGTGCPRCRNSHGETGIERVLDCMDIRYEREKSFDTCRIKLYMKFDFYLPDYGVLIEYHGIQHFASSEWNGGLGTLMYITRNDEYKRRWAVDNGFVIKEYRFDDKWSFIEKSIRSVLSWRRRAMASA